MIRNILIVCSFCLFIFSPLHSYAEQQKPRWTLEMNAGLFEPEHEDENGNVWSDFYGSKRMPELGISIAYRIFYVLDLGMSINYGQDQGTGYLPVNGRHEGDVTYRMLPVELFALLRLRFTEGQWIVPYAGGGYTRFAYHQAVSDQDSTRGSVNGQHLRAGIQLLLDPLDKSAAKEMLRAYGGINSYLYFEVKRTKAEAGSPVVELGGYSYKTGLMVEFR